MRPQPKPNTIRDESRLNFVRRMPCLIKDHRNHKEHCLAPNGGSQAHHIWDAMNGGVAKKPSDFVTIALCPLAHREYHDHGKSAFEKFYGICIEDEIFRINLEFSLANQQKKRERKTKPCRLVVTCECGEKHDMPLSKTNIESVRYFCRRRREYVEREA